jgi:hypothetical protein
MSENKVLERQLERQGGEIRTAEYHVTRNLIIFSLHIQSTGWLNQEVWHWGKRDM